MSFDPNKLVIIAENQQLVYNAGYEAGKSAAGIKTDIVVIKEPTCSEVGELSFTCSCCGSRATEVIPTLDHTYDGSTCSVCGHPDPYHLDNYPVQDTLSGLYVLGDTRETSLINHAKNSTAVPYDIVNETTGWLTYEDSCVTISGHQNKNRIKTNVIGELTVGVTWVALFKVPSGSRTILGTRRGHTPSASGMDLLNNRVEICIDKKATSLNFNEPIVSDNFAIIAITATTDGCRVVRYTNGKLDVDNPLVDYVGPIDAWSNFMWNNEPANAINIGGNTTGDVRSTASISMAALHDGVVDDNNLARICDFIYVNGTKRELIIE